MKLIFKKDNENEISVIQKVNGEEQDFSYVDMIKDLIKLKKMEDPEILDGFTETEKKSISSMVTHINKGISTTEEEE